MVNNKDNRVFILGTIGLIVAPWIFATSFPGPFPWLGGAPPPSQGKGLGNEVRKFDVLKTSIFALEASLPGNYLF